MSERNKTLSVVSYFGVLLALFTFIGGLICSIVIYFAAADKVVKNHAKKAFITQIIPFLFFVPYLLFFYGDDRFINIYIIQYSGILLIISGIWSFIWNLIQGVKVLQQ